MDLRKEGQSMESGTGRELEEEHQQEVETNEKLLHHVSVEAINEIEQKLVESGCGGSVSIDISNGRSKKILYFTAVPPSCDQVLIREGAIMAVGNKDASTIISMFDRYYCKVDAKWNYKDLGDGRVTLTCAHAGKPRPSKGAGIRQRSSKKQNCSARLKLKGIRIEDKELFCVPNASSAAEIRLALHDEVVKKTCMTSKEGKYIQPSNFLHVVSMDMSHKCQAKEIPVLGEVKSRREYSSTSALGDERLRKAMTDFVSTASHRHRGNLSRLVQYLHTTVPEVVFSEDVVRNMMQGLERNEQDALELVQYLREQRDSESGSVEYLQVGLNDWGALEYCTWAPSGSRARVRSYGKELGSIDATHKSTRYTLKFISWVIVNCEDCTRPVLFSLIQDETTRTFERILSDFMRAFGLLPRVIYTDQDFALSCAIASVPRDIFHLLCIWHLIDHNCIRPKVAAHIQGGNGNWMQFRSQFILVRNAGSIDEFNRLWTQLINTWLPLDTIENRKQTAGAREYLEKEIYAQRRKWAYAFFPDAPTLGLQSTQRNEAWNGYLKFITSPHMPLALIAKKLNEKVLSMDREEIIRATKVNRHASIAVPSFIPNYISKPLMSRNISNFASKIFTEEFSAALRMSAYNPSSSVDEGTQEVTVTCRVRYALSNNEYESLSTPIVTVKGKRTDPPNNGLAYRMEPYCPCNFFNRMLLPCRHMLALAMGALKNGSHSEETSAWRQALQQLKRITGITDDGNVLKAFINLTVGERWFHCFIPKPQEDVDGSNCFRSAPAYETIGRESTVLDNRDRKWLLDILQSSCTLRCEEKKRCISSGLRFGEPYSSFPLRSDGDGTPNAYSQLMSMAKSVCTELCADASGLAVAKTLMSMLSNVLYGYRALQQQKGSLWILQGENHADLLRLALSAAVNLEGPSDRPLVHTSGRVDGTFSSKDLVHRGGKDVRESDMKLFKARDEYAKNVSDQWRRETILPWDGLVCAVGNDNSSGGGEVDISVFALQHGIDMRSQLYEEFEATGHYFAPKNQSGLKEVTGQKRSLQKLEGSQEILNPPKRARIGKDVGNANAHRGIRERKRRKDVARRVPVTSRGHENHQGEKPNIQVPRCGTGWACTHCICIKVQSNMKNVLQHWRSRHRKKFSREPNDEQMRVAAASFSERIDELPKKGEFIKVRFELGDSGKFDWFKGKVTKITPNGYTVKYDDGDTVTHDFHNSEKDDYVRISEDNITEDETSESDIQSASQVDVVDVKQELGKEDKTQTRGLMNNQSSSISPDILQRRLSISNKCVIDMNRWDGLVSFEIYADCSVEFLAENNQVEKLDKETLKWFRATITSANWMEDYGEPSSVTVKYESGQEETWDDYSAIRWRPLFFRGEIQDLELFQTPHSAILSDVLAKARQIGRTSSDRNKTVVYTNGSVRLHATDVLSLEDRSWVSDIIVDTFAKAILNAPSSTNDRFVLILSQAASFVTKEGDSSFRERLLRWLRGIQLHDFDTILWPVCRNSHWVLCVARTATREVFIVDPYDPAGHNNKTPDSIVMCILEGLMEMTREYDSFYGVSLQWNLSSSRIVEFLGSFWKQPSYNSTDCGVLVSLYMWSIIAGRPVPPISASYSRDISKLRTSIGNTIVNFLDAKRR